MEKNDLHAHREIRSPVARIPPLPCPLWACREAPPSPSPPSPSAPPPLCVCSRAARPGLAWTLPSPRACRPLPRGRCAPRWCGPPPLRSTAPCLASASAPQPAASSHAHACAAVVGLPCRSPPSQRQSAGQKTTNSNGTSCSLCVLGEKLPLL